MMPPQVELVEGVILRHNAALGKPALAQPVGPQPVHGMQEVPGFPGIGRDPAAEVDAELLFHPRPKCVAKVHPRGPLAVDDDVLERRQVLDSFRVSPGMLSHGLAHVVACRIRSRDLACQRRDEVLGVIGPRRAAHVHLAVRVKAVVRGPVQGSGLNPRAGDRDADVR